jgi:hypothetical protein
VSNVTPFPLTMATTSSVNAGGYTPVPNSPTYFIEVTPEDDVVRELPMYSIGTYMTAKGS